ncbi:MAG: sigma-70 family RNA polymerase sigma factor [Candidatus Latescibacterota bacterium]
MSERELTDEELIHEHRHGNAAALALLWVRYDRLVFGLAHGMLKSREYAQDVRQEVFLKVRAGLEELQAPSRFGPWVASITRNACRSWLRGQRPTCPLDSLSECEHPQASPTPGDQDHEQRTLLRQMIDRLPEEQRTVVELPMASGG